MLGTWNLLGEQQELASLSFIRIGFWAAKGPTIWVLVGVGFVPTISHCSGIGRCPCHLCEPLRCQRLAKRDVISIILVICTIVMTIIVIIIIIIITVITSVTIAIKSLASPCLDESDVLCPNRITIP